MLVDFRQNLTLHQLFMEQARQCPNTLACVYDDGQHMAYGDFLAIVRDAASLLQPFVTEKDA